MLTVMSVLAAQIVIIWLAAKFWEMRTKIHDLEKENAERASGTFVNSDYEVSWDH